jgi:transcriptional regulator of heat shock response
VLLHNQYQISERYISHVIYLKKSNPLEYFNSRKKRYIKKKLLQNSFRFQNIKNIPQFYSILVKNKKKFNATPTHSLQEIKKIISLYPDRCKLLGSFDNKKLVGGVFLFITSEKTSLLFYNVVSSKYANEQVGLFQVYQCIRWCLGKKIQILDLGVSHLPNNKNPLDPKLSLIKFKEQCGGLGVMRNIYTKKWKV